MRAAPLAQLAAALLALAPAAAQGSDPRGDPPPPIAIRLSYILGPGTKGCPPEQTLHDEVARRMGYDPFTPDAADRVVTTLSLAAHSSRATVEFHDNTGDHRWDDKTFTIPDHNCMALVTGIAIYISYMFAPFALPPTAAPVHGTPAPPTPADAPVPPPQPPAQAQPAPPPARASLPPAASPPPARPSPPRRPEIEVGTSPLVAFGIAPSVAVGAAFHVGLHWPSLSFSVALEGRADLPASAVMDASPHPRVKTSLAGGSILPCWYPHACVLLCGVATVGQAAGESSGISDPKVGHSAYLGAGLRAGVGARFADHLEGRVFGDMLGTIVPAQALIGGRGVWQTPPLTGDLGAALVAFF